MLAGTIKSLPEFGRQALRKELEYVSRDIMIHFVDGGWFLAHANDSAVAAGEAGLVQQRKVFDPPPVREACFLDFQRVQHSVFFDDDVDFLPVAVTIIAEFCSVFSIGVLFDEFEDNVVFVIMPADGTLH